LSDLVAVTEAEKALYLASGASVEHCIASAEYWAMNREMIWSALVSLKTKKELTVYKSNITFSSDLLTFTGIVLVLPTGHLLPRGLFKCPRAR
jgi:hypothetical protein